jgi:hypothetical protein
MGVLSRKGANDVVNSGAARRSVESETGHAEFPIEKAVVVEVCTGFNQSLIAAYMADSDSSIPAERIPRNACIVRRISGGADSSSSSNTLVYPFFSSHLSMPVKSGETVWVIFDRNVKSIGYWLSRVHGDTTSEDVNYSHFDRSFTPKEQPKTTPGTAEKASGPKEKVAPTEDFPNLSLRQDPDGPNTFYEIAVNNLGKHTKFEPVPRYFKKPEDLTIQGSNNTLISLTTDRGWSKADDPLTGFTVANSGTVDYSGTVDIVAGRGRWISLNESTRTIPETRSNTRGFVEVSKASSVTGSPNPSEGDPDFDSDAARLYVSMKSPIDMRLSLNDQTPVVPGEDDVRDAQVDRSVVALKSDLVRIVARKDDSHEINGNILIVKEGEKSDTGDHCAISLLEDGTVLISGQRILIGRSSADGGLEEGDSDAPGKMQPYVRYKQLEDLLKAIIADVKSFCDTLNTHVTPGYGAPSPQILQAAASLKSAMSSRESEIVNLKSKRIFGE